MPSIDDLRFTYGHSLAFLTTRNELPLVLNARGLFGCRRRMRHNRFLHRFAQTRKDDPKCRSVLRRGLHPDRAAMRPHYALTLRAWVRRLEEHWDEAVAASSPGRARVWRLYMAASALAFEAGTMGVNQVLVQRPGGARPPLRRTAWT